MFFTSNYEAQGELFFLALQLRGCDLVGIIPNFIDSWNVFLKLNQEIKVLNQFCESKNIVGSIQGLIVGLSTIQTQINKCPHKNLHVDLVTWQSPWQIEPILLNLDLWSLWRFCPTS